MAKRKLGVSIIILCIAAVTLISGTYAWFLVGGFAELFDIGFDVIEATGGIWLRGDAGTYGGGKTDNDGWGDKLERSDFREMSFIVEGGRYRPVSSSNGTNFISVTMNGKDFICNGVAPSKETATDPAQICYNDFTFSIRSTGDEIVQGTDRGAYVKIKLSGERYNDDGTLDESTEGQAGAATAARVSITKDGETTIYSYDGQNYEAVTSIFQDGRITDDNEPQNYIIDSADANNGDAGLTAVTSPTLMDGENAIKIYLGNIPGTSSGKDITIRIWLEGNDPECIAFGEGAVAGKSLLANISFGVDE